MTTPAPEPVEVEAAELAAAEREFRELLSEGCDCGHIPIGALEKVSAEYDRMRAELTSLRRQAGISERAANGFYAHAAAMELQRDTARADLSRALPVVEAAGALVRNEEVKPIPGKVITEWRAERRRLLDALARAYRAGKEQG